jgi:transcriptional regulator with XRE-family HTH domain
MPRPHASPEQHIHYMRRAPYNPKPFIARLKQLLAERNESYREAALKSGLDHQAVRRIVEEEHRPHMHICILLADHFGVNPNEFLQLASYPTLKAFDIQTESAEHLPPEAVNVARDIARISSPKARKAVAEAIQVLLKQQTARE